MSKFRIMGALVIFLLIINGCSTYNGIRGKKDISPVAYGLLSAKNGEERFWALYNAHVAAKTAGVDVDYSGIRQLDIEIPKEALSIPLTNNNDFRGVVFNIKNTCKDFFLFINTNVSEKITIEKKDIDRGDYRGYPQLKSGRYLVRIVDDNLWVKNREGSNYGHTRKDIVLVKNGVAANKTVMPYNNDNSEPSCVYYANIQEGLRFVNVTLNRSSDSNKKTYLCKLSGFDNLSLENITVTTPDNTGENDRAIEICDCTNVIFNNVSINGTYSRTNYSGYGIVLSNIWNFKAYKLEGNGNWGIFGNNNVNKAFLKDCNINRFDVHCYGKDISFENTHFFDLYNQFSSVYGIISFDHCVFDRFVPVLNELSYNSYVPGEIVFKDCVYRPTVQRCYIIDIGRLRNDINTRPELTEKHWPDVSIKNMTIEMPAGAEDLYLFLTRKDTDYIDQSVDVGNIKIDGLRFIYDNGERTANFNLTNVDVNASKSVEIDLMNIDIMPETRSCTSRVLGGEITAKITCPTQDKKPIIRLSKSKCSIAVR